MKKRLFTLSIFSVFLALVFYGCSSGSTDSNNDNASNDETNSAEEVTLKVGYMFGPDSAVDEGAKKFAELVDEKSDGQVKIDLYNNGTLGGDREMMESMQTGMIDMTIIGDTAISMFAPEYEGIITPYVIRDIDHLHNVLASEIGAELEEEFLNNLDSTVLDWWDRNPRNLTANKAVETPDDLKGLKLRVPEIPVFIDAWKELGANPTPVSGEELFSALESGVVDGQENPLDAIYTHNMYEVQSHVMLTEHVIAPIMVFIGNKTLDGLSEDVQNIIREAAVEAGEFQRQLVKDLDDEYIEKLEEVGTTIVEIDKELFAEKLMEANLEENYADKWKPNLIQDISEIE